MTIPLGQSLPIASRDLPGQRRENSPATVFKRDSPPSLFGLAPGGVYPANPISGVAVRSYHTLSPLPAYLICAGGLLSVALSLGLPPPGITRHRVSVEPGLSSSEAFKLNDQPAVIQPSDPLFH